MLMYVPDEFLLVKAIDTKNVTDWDDFEFLLTIIIENRILKLYVELYLTPLNKRKESEALDLLFQEEEKAESSKIKAEKKAPRKKKNHKKKGNATESA